MNEKVREALERAERWMGDCTELATIRAHIEGLEARVRELEAGVERIASGYYDDDEAVGIVAELRGLLPALQENRDGR